MASKSLFPSTSKSRPPTTTTNLAGGKAYSLADKEALAQLVMTGCLGSTFYASDEYQLKTILEIAGRCEARFVGQCALVGRKKGKIKDAPALLLAHLAARGELEVLKKVFPDVIDNARMVRTFVQIVRSGQTGRKSMGSAVRNLVRDWINRQHPEALFRSSVGNDPSMGDVVKMVHPRPRSPEAGTVFRWMLGKEFSLEEAPSSLRLFERWKKEGGKVPEGVPHEMLTNRELTKDQWTDLVKSQGWQFVRMNLNTFTRHNLWSPTFNKYVADRLRDPDSIAKARVLPYQLLTAFAYADDDVPLVVKDAMQDAIEIATQNTPDLGDALIMLDVSLSMGQPVTGGRGSATSKVTCGQTAALFSACALRTSSGSRVIPFDTGVHSVKINPRDSIMTIAAQLQINGGGTDCSCALAHANAKGLNANLVVYLSDNESWADPSNVRTTAVIDQWNRFKKRNLKAKLVCVDMAPNVTTQAPNSDDIMNIGGFSDSVWEMVARFAEGKSGDVWVKSVEEFEVGAR